MKRLLLSKILLITLLVPKLGFTMDARREKTESFAKTEACFACGAKKSKEGGSLKRCTKCKKALYCGTECQRVAWAKKEDPCQQKIKYNGIFSIRSITGPDNKLYELSKSQEEFLSFLKATPYDSYVEKNSPGDILVRKRAQQAFETFREEFDGDSHAAKKKLVECLHNLKLTGDIKTRTEVAPMLERVFDGVGDEEVRWMA